MVDKISLETLGIPWESGVRDWHKIPHKILPSCSAFGVISDLSGNRRFKLKSKGYLGKGTFGQIDSFYREDVSGTTVIALKRPNKQSVNLLLEGLFQWNLHNSLINFEIEFSVPKVYDIFVDKITSSVWFTMEAFKPICLASWCIGITDSNTFLLLMLQLSLILEVFQKEFHIDHRDLKANNILIVEQKVSITIVWNGVKREMMFPFRIVFIDFGFACNGTSLDIREKNGIPLLDPCPKQGRDIFQILVSLWKIKDIRRNLESSWGSWIRKKLSTVVPEVPVLRYLENLPDLNWLYTMTDDKSFKAPLCTPTSIIKECMDKIDCK